MIRLLLAPLILVLAALSFPALDAYRRTHWYGWTAPEMEVHWLRLKHWKREGDFDHVAKNILSEWVRLDAQRAGKLFAFLLTISVILNILLLIAWRLAA